RAAGHGGRARGAHRRLRQPHDRGGAVRLRRRPDLRCAHRPRAGRGLRLPAGGRAAAHRRVEPARPTAGASVTTTRTGTLGRLVLASRPLSWINTAYPFAAAYVLTTREVHLALVVGTLF